MSKPDKNDVYKAILDASLPLSWFNFKRLVGSGDIHLKGPEKPLASWLLFAYYLHGDFRRAVGLLLFTNHDRLCRVAGVQPDGPRM